MLTKFVFENKRELVKDITEVVPLTDQHYEKAIWDYLAKEIKLFQESESLLHEVRILFASLPESVSDYLTVLVSEQL